MLPSVRKRHDFEVLSSVRRGAPKHDNIHRGFRDLKAQKKSDFVTNLSSFLEPIRAYMRICYLIFIVYSVNCDTFLEEILEKCLFFYNSISGIGQRNPFIIMPVLTLWYLYLSQNKKKLLTQ